MAAQQKFGGSWTEEKLERLHKYLAAYAKIMNKQGFRFGYIDAFAGTGYLEMKAEDSGEGLLFPELAEPEPRQFIEGSARIALQIEPRFTKYIFIEKSSGRAAEL